jgi:hypothetical protein
MGAMMRQLSLATRGKLTAVVGQRYREASRALTRNPFCGRKCCDTDLDQFSAIQSHYDDSHCLT